MKTRVEGGRYLVRDDDPGPIVYAMPSRPRVPEPDTSQPPEWTRPSPDEWLEMGGYGNYRVAVPPAVEHRSSEPPSGQSAREAARRNEEEQQHPFATFRGGTALDEKACLCGLQKAYDRHWGARASPARDEEGRLMRHIGDFPELDDAGTSQCQSEHDEANYELRREAEGFSLHREEPDNGSDAPVQDWVRPHVRGSVGDKKRSFHGREANDIRRLQKAHDAYWRGRVF
jgi:hypothetical protein